MLNTTNYYRNASQTYSKIITSPVRMPIIKNSKTIKAGEAVEKGKLSWTVGANKNC